MKFRADAKGLRAAVAELTSIVKPNPKDDVPPCVNLTLIENNLTMRVCDIQGAYYAERYITVENNGDDKEIVLDLAEFNSALSVQEGKIDLEQDGKELKVKQGRTHLIVSVLPFTVTKLTAPAQDQWFFADEAEQIVQAANRANRHREQDDDPRYAIIGISLENDEGYLTIVGTDGTSLSAVKTEMKVPNFEGPVVVRPEFVPCIATYEKGRSLSLSIGPDGIWLKQPERLDLVTKISDAPYPKYRNLLEAEPTVCGTIGHEELARLKTVIQKGVVGTTQHGNVWISGKDGSIEVWGKDKRHVQSLPSPQVKFPSMCLAAGNLTSVLSMFNGELDMKISKNRKRVFFSQDNQLAIMFVEEVKDE